MPRPPRKRPPAPSARRRCDINAAIAAELYAALERLDADEELLSIIGSWRDTLEDAEVLTLLREFNATGRLLHRRH